jgi:hypothetical protein
MIQIRPTTDSGLSAITYAVDLPGEINPQRPRAQKVTTTLSGGAAVTSWAKNNEGASQSVQVTITQANHTILLKVVNHATVFEWLVFCDGRRYKCTVDIDQPVSVYLRGIEYKQVNVSFVVVKDYN